ncbi:MAG TPA: hypothetical protein VG603_04905 [Chitinophagales bacterium]|nr:hypothetical protein [Chitinophagales bacterium]
MSKEEEQLEQLRHIRNMMERSSRFISLSGLSGVFAGFFALAGAGAFYFYLHRKLNYAYTEYARAVPVELSLGFRWFCILDAAAVVTLSLLFAVFFTTRMAKSKGQKIWDASARRMLFNLAVPLISGGIYCLVLLHYGWFGMVAPATLIFYGLALLNASKYTLDEIKWLGLSEIALGLIGCFFIGYGITLWAIGFGVLHIIYGLMMYARYETKPVENKYW